MARRYSRNCVAIAVVLLSGLSVSASETEQDTCTCKSVQKGAQSTLTHGTCTRTEASNCLMEWSSRSGSSVQVGNGMSAVEAARKAEASFMKGFTGYEPIRSPIPGFEGSQADNARVLLASTPPEKYGSIEVSEAFLLLAASAMTRFDVDITAFASDFDSTALLKALGGGDVKQFEGKSGVKVQARKGCLVATKAQSFQIFVKTQFASDESC
jgi:hypothetical protein